MREPRITCLRKVHVLFKRAGKRSGKQSELKRIVTLFLSTFYLLVLNEGGSGKKFGLNSGDYMGSVKGIRSPLFKHQLGCRVPDKWRFGLP